MIPTALKKVRRAIRHTVLVEYTNKELGLPTELFAERLCGDAFHSVRCSVFRFCL